MKKHVATTVLALVLCLGWACLAMGRPALSQPAGAPADQPLPGMFALYERNRHEGVPNYITEDFLLMATMNTMEQVVGDLEGKVLAPRFQALLAGLAQALEKAQKQPGGDSLALRANLDFLAVLQALMLGPEAAANLSERAAQELELVRGAQGIAMSPLWGVQIDYSQFRPRGRYTRTEVMSRYFQALRYAGSVLFPVRETMATGVTPVQADQLTSQALMLMKLLAADKKLLASYQDFLGNMGLLFGPPDDLTMEDYQAVVKGKKNLPLAELRKQLLKLARDKGRQPSILQGLVNHDGLEQGVTPADALTGWRLIPLAFTPDSAAMQELVFNRVGDHQGQGQPFSLTVVSGRPVKGFPLGLELMALLGSRYAENILNQHGEIAYQGYASAKAHAQGQLKKAKGLAAQDLEIMRKWLAAKSQPDAQRRLNTCLAYWALGRHANLLYAKQSYTAAGKGMELEAQRGPAWLEPAPELYGLLAARVEALAKISPDQRLTRLKAVLARCQEIAKRLERKAALKTEDHAFLNGLDLELADMAGGLDLPLVADVHSDPASNQVLEAAVGLPRLVEHQTGHGQARGALFSYYEFKQPLNQRLTDQEWQSMAADPQIVQGLALSPSVLWKTAPDKKPEAKDKE